MSVTKSVVTISSVAIALLFGGGAFLVMNLGSITKNITEKIASDTLGVPVTIGKLDISLQEKTATVTNLKIGNPDGFSKPYVLSVDTIEIMLGNISQELIEFNNITIRGTNVNLEVRQDSTNLTAIKNQMKKTAPPSENKSGNKKASKPVKVIIDKLVMAGANLNPSVTLINEHDLQPVVIPDIHLRDIGRKENGILVREAIAQIWEHISRQAGKSAGSAGFYQGMSLESFEKPGGAQIQQIKNRFKGDINQLGTDIKNIFDN